MLEQQIHHLVVDEQVSSDGDHQRRPFLPIGTVDIGLEVECQLDRLKPILSDEASQHRFLLGVGCIDIHAMAKQLRRVVAHLRSHGSEEKRDAWIVATECKVGRLPLCDHRSMGSSVLCAVKA